jgi:hypothetical protein
VLVRDPAHRFEAQALLCTDLACDPTQIVSWFVRRWSVEVTFQEVRAHLGVETQRQWSDTAIARTTPCLLALFSINANGNGSRPPRGTPNRARPSPMLWPPCAMRSGASGLWQHHRADAPEQNPASVCQRPGPMPSATPHEWSKSR